MNYLMINTAGKTTEILLSAAGKKTFFCDENGLHASAVLLQAIDKMLCAANVKLNDIITIRGKGRFIIKQFTGTTRSGRTVVLIEKYI